MKTITQGNPGYEGSWFEQLFTAQVGPKLDGTVYLSETGRITKEQWDYLRRKPSPPGNRHHTEN